MKMHRLAIMGAMAPMSAADMIARAAEAEENVRRSTVKDVLVDIGTMIEKIEVTTGCMPSRILIGEFVTLDGQVLDPGEYEIESNTITLKRNLSSSYGIQANLEALEHKPEPMPNGPEPMLNGPRGRKRGKGKVAKW